MATVDTGNRRLIFFGSGFSLLKAKFLNSPASGGGMSK